MHDRVADELLQRAQRVIGLPLLYRKPSESRTHLDVGEKQLVEYAQLIRNRAVYLLLILNRIAELDTVKADKLNVSSGDERTRVLPYDQDPCRRRRWWLTH